MSRYFSGRSVHIDDNDTLVPDLSVPDHKPRDTGLLDARGDKIMKAPRPIGFGRDHEW